MCVVSWMARFHQPLDPFEPNVPKLPVPLEQLFLGSSNILIRLAGHTKTNSFVSEAEGCEATVHGDGQC